MLEVPIRFRRIRTQGETHKRDLDVMSPAAQLEQSPGTNVIPTLTRKNTYSFNTIDIELLKIHNFSIPNHMLSQNTLSIQLKTHPLNTPHYSPSQYYYNTPYSPSQYY